MATALCTTGDVSDLALRPLTAPEQNAVTSLITKASALLRNAVPSIDTRIAKYVANPSDKSGVDPIVVATVVGGIITRYIRNPDGYASKSAGPFSVSYALRSEKVARGVLEVNDSDLRTLFPNRKRLRAGTIRTRPGLAPRPVGRYGPYPSVGQAVGAVVDWQADLPVDGAEGYGFLPGSGGGT